MDFPAIFALHRLLQPEFISNGGLIRDLTPEELMTFSSRGGSVWASIDTKGEVLAGHTILPFRGSGATWHYFNHGVVHPSRRHQGGEILQSLLQQAIHSLPAEDGCFTITVARTIFRRLGFVEASTEELLAIDPAIAEVVKQKLRPGHSAAVMIRPPKNKEVR